MLSALLFIEPIEIDGVFFARKLDFQYVIAAFFNLGKPAAPLYREEEGVEFEITHAAHFS